MMQRNLLYRLLWTLKTGNDVPEYQNQVKPTQLCGDLPTS